jgi:hypothetical protein
MADAERDDWGFTDADHAELQALMRKHEAQIPEVLLALMHDGITPMPEDDGLMGVMARACPNDEGHTTRVFSKGGLWWALLEHLRGMK